METPCRDLCALDGARICVGCRRTVEEIVRWRSMTDAERSAIMARLARDEGTTQ